MEDERPPLDYARGRYETDPPHPRWVVAVMAVFWLGAFTVAVLVAASLLAVWLGLI